MTPLTVYNSVLNEDDDEEEADMNDSYTQTPTKSVKRRIAFTPNRRQPKSAHKNRNEIQLNKQISNLVNKNHELKKDIESKNERITTLNSKMKDIKEDLNKMKDEVIEKDKEIQKYKKSIENQRSLSVQKSPSKQKAATKKRSKSVPIKRQQEEKHISKSEIELNKQISNLVNKNHELKKDIDGKNEKINSLNEKVKNIKEDMNKMKDEMIEKDKEIEKYKKSLENQRSLSVQKSPSKQKPKTKKRSKSVPIKLQEQEEKHISKTQVELNTEIAELTKKNHTLQNEVIELKKKEEEMILVNKDMNKEIKELNGKIEEINTSKKDENNINKVENSNVSRNTTPVRRKLKFTPKKKEYSQSPSKKYPNKTEIELNYQIANLVKKNELLKEENVKCNTQITELMSEIKDLKNERNKLNETINTSSPAKSKTNTHNKRRSNSITIANQQHTRRKSIKTSDRKSVV